MAAAISFQKCKARRSRSTHIFPGGGYSGPKLLGTAHEKAAGAGGRKKRKRAPAMGGNKQNQTKDYPLWVLKKH